MKQFLAIVLFTLMSLGAWADEMSVLAVSPDVAKEEISRQDLVNIFLGKQTNWPDGRHINIGYCILPDSKVDQFLEKWVGKNHRRFKKYWVKKVFAGYGVAPKMFKNVKKSLDFVKKQEGSIVFVTVSGEWELEGVKTLKVDGTSSF